MHNSLKKKKNAKKQNTSYTILVIAIFVLAFALRLFRVEQNFIFSGEVGHNLLAIKQAFLLRHVPLIGPPTSHEWMYFGPLFYWIYGPILILSKFNPLSHAYFGAICSFSIVVIHYFVIRKVFNERIALFSTALLAVSPLFLEFGRAGRFFSLVTLLIYPFLLFLYNVVRGESKYFFWLWFTYGCMFSFHFTPLMLLPFIVSVFFIQKVSLSWTDIRNSILGFILPLTPFLLYDITHGATMVSNILLWIPYRVAGFFGLYPKNTVSKAIVKDNVSSLYDFVSSSFVPDTYSIVGFCLFVIVAVYILLYIYRVIKRIPIAVTTQLVLLWLGWGYLAVFIHGSPPIHYFVPLLPLPILLFSILLDALSRLRKGFIFSVFVLVVLGIANIYYLFSTNWFFYRQDTVVQKPFYVPFQLQMQVTSSIIRDAKGQQFVLKRVGPDDQFEADYAQNYMYLLWLKGNEPVKKAPIVYTIYELKQDIPKNVSSEKRIGVSDITIIKESKTGK